jgi:hypothetical protein
MPARTPRPKTPKDGNGHSHHDPKRAPPPPPADEDPLARALAPPKNEKPHERDARLLAEREAKKISDSIDDELNRQRLAERKKPVKILLLGASVVPHLPFLV